MLDSLDTSDQRETKGNRDHQVLLLTSVTTEHPFKDHQVPQVSMVFLVSVVTRDLQDSQDHQANLGLVGDLDQVVQEPQVFQGPQAQRERRVTRGFLGMVQKGFPVPQDSQDPLDLLDLRAQPVLLTGRPPAPPGHLGLLAPEESPVTPDTKASEVILGTVPASEGALLGYLGCLESQEVTAVLASLVERGNLVTVVPLVLVVSRDLLVGLVREVSLVVKERRGRLSTLTLDLG